MKMSASIFVFVVFILLNIGFCLSINSNGMLKHYLIVLSFINIKLYLTKDFIINDMVLNEEQLKAMKASPGSSHAIIGKDYRWDGGVIPFWIDNATITDPENREIIIHSIVSFNKRTCGCVYFR